MCTTYECPDSINIQRKTFTWPSWHISLSLRCHFKSRSVQFNVLAKYQPISFLTRLPKTAPRHSAYMHTPFISLFTIYAARKGGCNKRVQHAILTSLRHRNPKTISLIEMYFHMRRANVDSVRVLCVCEWCVCARDFRLTAQNCEGPGAMAEMLCPRRKNFHN